MGKSRPLWVHFQKCKISHFVQLTLKAPPSLWLKTWLPRPWKTHDYRANPVGQKIGYLVPHLEHHSQGHRNIKPHLLNPEPPWDALTFCTVSKVIIKTHYFPTKTSWAALKQTAKEKRKHVGLNPHRPQKSETGPRIKTEVSPLYHVDRARAAAWNKSSLRTKLESKLGKSLWLERNYPMVLKNPHQHHQPITHHAIIKHLLCTWLSS